MVDFSSIVPAHTKPIHGHRLRLPEAPAPLPSLRIGLGVPVGVVQCYPVSPYQFKPTPPVLVVSNMQKVLEVGKLKASAVACRCVGGVEPSILHSIASLLG